MYFAAPKADEAIGPPNPNSNDAQPDKNPASGP